MIDAFCVYVPTLALKQASNLPVSEATNSRMRASRAGSSPFTVADIAGYSKVGPMFDKPDAATPRRSVEHD